MSLPKLPVPPLEQTLAKYEKTMRPLLDNNRRAKLRTLIEDFGREGGLGRKLQLYLIDRREKTDNWVNKKLLKSFTAHMPSLKEICLINYSKSKH